LAAPALEVGDLVEQFGAEAQVQHVEGVDARVDLLAQRAQRIRLPGADRPHEGRDEDDLAQRVEVAVPGRVPLADEVAVFLVGHGWAPGPRAPRLTAAPSPAAAPAGRSGRRASPPGPSRRSGWRPPGGAGSGPAARPPSPARSAPGSAQPGPWGHR